MLTIGRLAKQARVSTDSIRFYEREGLIEPTTKTGSGYRLYSEAATHSLGFIKHAQRCGFSLAEIRALLRARNGEGSLTGDFYRVALEKQAHIEQTMAALRSMSDALSAVIQMRGVDEPAPSFGDAGASPLLIALGSQNASGPAVGDSQRP